MMDPSQFRLGKGGFTQTLLPKEKIPSPATRSGATPSSRNFWADSQALPVPNQIERFAYTEFGFKSLSGSTTFAYIAKPRCSLTGSIPDVDGIPSVHFSTKTGGLAPVDALIADLHSTVLFVRSTTVIVIASVDRREKLLYAHRSPASHTLSLPSTSPLGVARAPL